MDTLEQLPRVGPALAGALRDAGFSSIEDVAVAKPDALTVVKGVGPVTAADLVSAAASIVDADESAGPAVDASATSDLEPDAETVKRRAKLARKLHKRRRQLAEVRAKKQLKKGKKRKKLAAQAKTLEQQIAKLKRKLT